MVHLTRNITRLAAVALIVFAALAAIALTHFLPVSAGENSAPEVNFSILDYYSASQLNVDNHTEVFYGDRLTLISNVTDPDGDNITAYEWTFKSNDTGLTTSEDRKDFNFTTGVDDLFSETDSGGPVMPQPNTSPVNYTLTLKAWDENNNVGERTMYIRVFPYAQHTFSKLVKMGDAYLYANVTLTWRGKESQAAAASYEVGPARPVFVYINETESPEPDLNERGGLGKVYDIHAVGCYRQDGTKGFISAEVKLPYQTSELGEIGDPLVLEKDIRLEYYNGTEGGFLAVKGSHALSESGVNYASGTVTHFSIYTAIVDSIYNKSNPNHDNVLPDLQVYGIRFSRSAALDGQEVEVRAHIRCDGVMIAKDVDASFYYNDVLIKNQTIDAVYPGSTDIVLNATFRALLIDHNRTCERHNITVIVNKNRTVEEAPDNYQNDRDEVRFDVVNPGGPGITMNITAPENKTVVSGTVRISGTASMNAINSTFGTFVSRIGIGDWGCNIGYAAVGDRASPVVRLTYTILDSDGKPVAGGNGTVKDIYGLNFDDPSTNISFQDNDRDGKVTPGDVFLLRDIAEGGVFSYDYTLQLNATTVKEVEYSINGGEWAPANGTGNWSFDWNSGTVENGNVTIRLRAFDGITYSAVSEITLNVQNQRENIRPLTEITEPEQGEKVKGTVVIKGTASDTDGTVQRVEISINGGEWMTADGTESWFFQWDTTKEENGNYTIRVRSYDGTNYSEEKTLKLIVDNNEKSSGGGGGFIAGFETGVLLAGLFLTAVIYRRRH